MRIERITSEDFVELSFETKVNFQFQNNDYLLEVVSMQEIGMSNYELEIVIKKNEQVEFQKRGHLPEYWQFISPKNNFLAIPHKFGVEIINLKNSESTFFQKDNNLIIGNQFSEDENLMLLLQVNELNLISTKRMVSKFRLRDPKIEMTQGKIDPNNNLLIIEDYYNKKRIEIINSETLKSSLYKIQSPFSFYQIEKNKFSKFINHKSHTLRVDNSNGLQYSGQLNNWIFVPSQENIIYKALIPVSISNSDVYGEICNCKTEYVKFIT